MRLKDENGNFISEDISHFEVDFRRDYPTPQFATSHTSRYKLRSSALRAAYKFVGPRNLGDTSRAVVFAVRADPKETWCRIRLAIIA